MRTTTDTMAKTLGIDVLIWATEIVSSAAIDSSVLTSEEETIMTLIQSQPATRTALEVLLGYSTSLTNL